MPLYVAAGTILPLGPVKQYTSENVDEPLSLSVYPGADGSFLLYEDDGRSFNFRKGEWMATRLHWDDARHRLTLSLAPGSRMISPRRKKISVKLLDAEKNLVFDGNPVQVTF